jgi:hypothetical protein
MRPLALIASIPLVAGLALAPVPARAQAEPPATAAKPPAGAPTEPPDAGAKARFAAAQALFEKRDFAAALPAFREVYAALGSPNAHLYLARCLRELGRLPEAYEELSATVVESAARAEKEPRFLATRDAAAAERALLEAKVARLVVAVAKPPPGVEVEVGGKPLAAARLGQPIAVAPGATTVVAKAPGRTSAREEVTIAAGALATVALSLDAATPPPVAAPPPATAAAPPPRPPPAREAPLAPTPRRDDSTLRLVGFGVLAIGVGGFVTAAVTGAMANGRFSSIREECGGMRCADPAVNDRVDGGRGLDTAANVGLVIGALGVAGGAAMVWFGGPPLFGKRASVGVAPGGAMLRGAF